MMAIGIIVMTIRTVAMAIGTVFLANRIVVLEVR